MAGALPSVTVVLPVLNEAEWIDECLATLAAQDYEGTYDVVVADGGSTDDTCLKLDAWKDRLSLQVVANDGRVQSLGVNLAVEHAAGEVIVRADGHTTYARDYIARSVAALLGRDAVAAGGLMSPLGTDSFTSAVASAMQSPFAVGPGKFHHAAAAGPADTVYLGAFRRSDFVEAGGYRTFPSGVAEDADLYHRWRRQGLTVWLDPSIRSTYRPRRKWSSLFRQYFRWGRGKSDMLYVNGRWPSWRPLAPLVLVAGLAAGAILAVVATPWPLAVVAASWLVILLLGARRAGGNAALALAVAAVMHLAYGLGLVAGLVRGPWAPRSAALRL